MEFRKEDNKDVQLNEIGYNRATYKCELLMPSPQMTSRQVKIVISEDKITLQNPNTKTILEEWPFSKIRGWSVVNHWFATSEIVLDLLPYHDQNMIIASDQVLPIVASINVATAKRAKELQEGLKSKHIEFVYYGVQKFTQKVKKRVVLELSKIGVKVMEDSENFFSFFNNTVLLEKNLVELKAYEMIGDDKFALDFGLITERCLFQHENPKAVINSIKKFIEEKQSGDLIESQSSEDDELDNE